jgi:cytochrome c oxidase subunit 2
VRAFRRPAKAKTTVLALIAATIVILTGCAASTGTDPDGRGAPGFFPPPAASDQGVNVTDIYPLIFWIAAGVFVLVEGLIIFAMLRYRRRPGDTELPPQIHGNNLLELIWVVIPAAVVAVLFVLTIGILNKTEARPADDHFAVTVDVHGFQWQWMFEYQEQGFTLTGLGEKGPEMGLPAGVPILVRLHSDDVIHSFYVPRFLYKKDVVPGRVNEFPITISQPGQVYGGQCAEYCGLSHNSMYFTVHSMTQADFDAWVAVQQANAKKTPPPTPSGGPAAATVQLSASNATAFDQQTAQAPANTPFTIVFMNKDAAAPHNVSIKNATPAGDFVGDPIAKAGETAQYSAPPLAPGEYTFYCVVHPNMTGKLTVQ